MDRKDPMDPKNAMDPMDPMDKYSAITKQLSFGSI
jgi:hypothetical protein